MTTIQERFRRVYPELFENDQTEDPEVIAIRDRPEWNDPFYRQMMVFKCIHDEVTPKEHYWVITYCQEESLPYRLVMEDFEEKLFEDVPKPFSVRMFMCMRKIHRFISSDNFLFRVCKPLAEVQTLFVTSGLLTLTAVLFPSSTLLGGITSIGGFGAYICLRHKMEEQA